MNPSLGYLHDHPLAVAARTDPAHWSLALLVPTSVAVPDDFDTDTGPVLDQDGVGACVAFAATGVRSYQEKLDEGGWEFTTASAFVAYDWLKHGHGTFPGDGAPTAEGSYPLAVCRLAKMEGLPGADGAARLIDAYYRLSGTPGDAAWIDVQTQVLLQYGPLTICSIWPTNWWSAPSSGLLPYPNSAIAGGHMYVRKGYWLKGPIGPLSGGMSPSGRYWRHRQSWGPYGRTDKFGRSGEFLLPFEADATYPNLQINEVWKTVDHIDHPKPPTPGPGGPMLAITDKLSRLVDSTVGAQVYDLDGKTPLVKIGSGPLNLASPCALAGGFLTIVVSIGGILQLGAISTIAVTNIRIQGDVSAEHRRWTDWIATQPK